MNSNTIQFNEIDGEIKATAYIDKLNRFCVHFIWPMAADPKMRDINVVRIAKRWYLKDGVTLTKFSKRCGLSYYADKTKKIVMSGRIALSETLAGLGDE